MPSDTYVTASPEWHWLVIFYFFFGGIAGGSYALASLIYLCGSPEDRPLGRIGYFISFPAVVLCGPLLMVDLTRPERFWHMVIQSERYLPMFKWWSPMSVGSWALMLFGVFSFLSFLAALAEDGRLPIRALAALHQGAFGKVFVTVGAVLAFFLASYTGVLLSVTNRPIWADTTLLGLVFLLSGVSTAAALMILLAGRRPAVPARALQALYRFDDWVMLLELVALAAVVVSLGAVATAWMNVWGLLLLVGVVLAGILLPILLHHRHLLGRLSIPVASLLVLAGGLILRAVVVLSSEAIHPPPLG
jgi:formate-dependent nitrite reductase membrane component NrfD